MDMGNGMLTMARDTAMAQYLSCDHCGLFTRLGRPMLAAQMCDEALVCQTWLRTTMNAPFDGTTVAITHFAPSLDKSADPRYGSD